MGIMVKGDVNVKGMNGISVGYDLVTNSNEMLQTNRTLTDVLGVKGFLFDSKVGCLLVIYV